MLSTAVPGESCWLLTPGSPLPHSHPQSPHPVAPGGDCGGFPPLSTSPGHSGPQRQVQMSHNTGILWTGSVISDLCGYTVSPQSFGLQGGVSLGSFLFEHILWTKSYVYGEERAFPCPPPQMETRRCSYQEIPSQQDMLMALWALPPP